jgi:uncharacterized membrane protein
MHLFGAIKSFSWRRLGPYKYTSCLIGAILVIIVSMVLEYIAVVWGAFGQKKKFVIVEKDVDNPTLRIKQR